MKLGRRGVAMGGRLGFCAALVAFGAACGPAVDVDDGGMSTGDTTDDGDTGGNSNTIGTSVGTTASTTASTSVGTTIGTTDMPSTTAGPTSDVTTESTVTSVTTDSDTATGGGLPNGQMCEDSEQCASGFCFVVGPLGGICGECILDEDCAGGGCSIPNPLANPPVGSTCTGGAYGGGCMTDEACADPYVCANVVSVPGIIEVSTCGECIDDGDCGDGFACAPDIAIMALTGVKRCVSLGTLANGQSCDLAAPSGDASCASGHCAAADVLGVLQLGVCSECESGADCGDLECQPPLADPSFGLQAGYCG